MAMKPSYTTNWDTVDCSQRFARPAPIYLPNTAQLTGQLAAMAQQPLGQRRAKCFGALEGDENEGLSGTERGRLAMGSAATSCREGKPERACVNAIGAGHRPADDNRTR